METRPREIRRYATLDDKVPVTEWMESLQNNKARRKIKSRLERVELGNLGAIMGASQFLYS